jgi:site-specific recombinase XerD
MSKQLIDNFIAHLNESGKSQATITAYKKDLEQLAEHTDVPVSDIKHEELKALIEVLRDKYQFTPKTVSRKLNSYRTFYKHLYESGHIKHNPAEKVEHPKVQSKPARVLSAMEYLALREVSRDNPRLHAMIELLLQTGLRIGELARLKAKHVSIDLDGHLHVEQYSSIDERKVPLNSKARRLLSEYLTAHQINHPEHPLFPTRDGKHIIVRNIRSSIDRAMAKAGIKDACVNDLRNTFIVHQLKSGVPMDIVADAVGHKSRTTTQKYLDLLENDYRASGEAKLADI